MAVSESKSASAIVIISRVVHDRGRRWFRVSIHLGDEVGVVNTVVPFIQNNERHGGPWAEDVGHRPSYGRIWRSCSPTAFIAVTGAVPIAANPIAHGYTAAGHTLTLRILAIARVRGAVEDP